MRTKIIFTKLYSLLFFLNFITCCHSSYRSVDFDDIRAEGGFGSASLLSVSRIQASGNILSEEEKQSLTNSKYLEKIHSLYLQKQDLNDDFIAALCQNPTLIRLINLDVSENPNITNRSLQLILESDSLGSVRDLPQISGNLGIPSSTLYITAKKTSVKPNEPGRHEIILQRLGFSINYIHPFTGKETDTPAEYAVKFIECIADPISDSIVRMERSIPLYKRYSIVLTSWPFAAEGPIQKRPALIISNKNYQRDTHDCIVIMITSKHQSNSTLPIIAPKSAGLSRQSFLKFKLYTLNEKLILDVLGYLAEEEQENVQRKLSSIFNIGEK
jgi:mRNA interferase MazF